MRVILICYKYNKVIQIFKLIEILFFKDGEIDLEELVDDFITFLAAGQETTSSSLAFTIIELGLNPHCFKRFV